MNRRSYLASLAIMPTGGCMSSAMNSSSSTFRRKSVSVSNVRKRVPTGMENVDEDEEPSGLEFDVRVFSGEITRSSTARLAITYANGGDSTLTLDINPDEPAPIKSIEIDSGLILLPDTFDPSRRSSDCWKPTKDHFPYPAVAYQHPIEPGESVRLEYDVWASPDQSAGCIQTKQYQFEPLYGAFTVDVSRDE